MMTRVIAAALIALSGVIGSSAQAQARIPGYPDDVTGALDPREVARLPRYCIYTQRFRDRVPGGNDRQQIAHWQSVMGDAYLHMHHYCWGLMKTNRALTLARTRHARHFYLNDAISEFDYVIARVGADFVLLPEILTRKAQNLVHLNRGPLGVIEFERAIELNPGYWPPYAYLSDYYKESGDLRKAREVLELGLSRSPDAAGLKLRLTEMDKSGSVNQRRSRSSN
jgi:tetratricopeptide (TPR) repeat protein